MSLTVLIPIKNESQIIDQTITELENSWIKQIDHEIIFLDDFSSDNTVQKIKDLDQKKLNINIIKNTKPGLGSAIHLGVINSNKDYFTIFMADLSDSIEDMQLYYNTIKKKLDEVLKMAHKAHKIIRCKGVTRSDFKYFKGKFYLLEINTQPGMTKLSLVPEIAAHNGMRFIELIEWILKDASTKR